MKQILQWEDISCGKNPLSYNTNIIQFTLSIPKALTEIKMEKCIAQQKSHQRNVVILSRWETDMVMDDTDKKNNE